VLQLLSGQESRGLRRGRDDHDRQARVRPHAAHGHYDELLAGSGVATPKAAPYGRHVYHIYAIRTANRAAWQETLQSKGIQTNIHYPIPVHLLPAFSDLGHRAGEFPHSERAANEVLSLPMFPELTRAQCEEVAEAVGGLARTA
jgi:dTDP-4-amino-4,6-dideoxygalactose transaminase